MKVARSCATVAVADTYTPCGPTSTSFMPACSSNAWTALTSAAAGAKRVPKSCVVKYWPYSLLVGDDTSVASVCSAAVFCSVMCTAIVTDVLPAATPLLTAFLTQPATWPGAVTPAVPAALAIVAAQAIAAAITPRKINRVLDLLSTRYPPFLAKLLRIHVGPDTKGPHRAARRSIVSLELWSRFSILFGDQQRTDRELRAFHPMPKKQAISSPYPMSTLDHSCTAIRKLRSETAIIPLPRYGKFPARRMLAAAPRTNLSEPGV